MTKISNVASWLQYNAFIKTKSTKNQCFAHFIIVNYEDTNLISSRNYGFCQKSRRFSKQSTQKIPHDDKKINNSFRQPVSIRKVNSVQCNAMTGKLLRQIRDQRSIGVKSSTRINYRHATNFRISFELSNSIKQKWAWALILETLFNHWHYCQ